MNFKDLKSGQTVYAVDLNKVEVYPWKVIDSPSLPHTDPKYGIGQMVVDVTIDVNGNAKTYVLPADSDCAYPQNMVVTTSRDVLLREIEAKKNSCQQSISMMDYYKECVSRCDTYISEYNPVFREKQETEARFAKIEKGQEEIMAMLKKLTV